VIGRCVVFISLSLVIIFGSAFAEVYVSRRAEDAPEEKTSDIQARDDVAFVASRFVNHGSAWGVQAISLYFSIAFILHIFLFIQTRASPQANARLFIDIFASSAAFVFISTLSRIDQFPKQTVTGWTALLFLCDPSPCPTTPMSYPCCLMTIFVYRISTVRMLDGLERACACITLAIFVLFRLSQRVDSTVAAMLGISVAFICCSHPAMTRRAKREGPSQKESTDTEDQTNEDGFPRLEHEIIEDKQYASLFPEDGTIDMLP